MLTRCFIDRIIPIYCFSRGHRIATPGSRHHRPRIPLHQFPHHLPATLAQCYRHRDPTDPRYPLAPPRRHRRSLLRHRRHRPTLPLPRPRSPHHSDALRGSDSLFTPPSRRGVQFRVPVASERQRVDVVVFCESGSGRVAHALAPFLLGGEYSVEGRSPRQGRGGRAERAGSGGQYGSGEKVSNGGGRGTGVLERIAIGGVVLSGTGPCDDF